MKALFIIVLCLLNTLLEAQNICLKGRLVDEHKKAVSSATVRCFIHDSVFVKGDISDSTGNFSITAPVSPSGYKLVINYIGYKEHVLHTKGDLGELQLGDIVLIEESNKLDEVVVTGRQITRTTDKVLYFPSKEQLRHASDGYKALALMMIPTLDVDPFTKKVSTIQGETLLLINGREASSDEIRNLNPKDILRIDFYDQHHPEYPNANSVVDYILEHHDRGGMVAMNGQQHLNKGNGSYGATGQIFNKKSEFIVSVSDSYNNYTPKRGYETSTYLKSTKETIVNEASSLPSPQNSNSINSYFNYLYHDKHNQLYTTLVLNQEKSDEDDLSMQTYSNDPVRYKVDDNSSSHNFNPALRIEYTGSLKHEQYIRFRLSGNYNQNKYDRQYEALQNDKITLAYNTHAKENNYRVIPQLMYRKTVRKSDVLFVLLNYDHTYAHTQYEIDGQLSDDYQTKGEGRLTLGYAFRLKNKLKMTVQWADQLTYIDNKKESSLQHFFSPGLFMTYMINENNSIRFTTALESGDLGLQYRSLTEQRIDKYQIRRGNPEVKVLKFYLTGLTYSLNTPVFNLTYHTSFEVTTDVPYERVSYDESRNLFIHDYAIAKSGFDLVTGPRMKLKVIPGKLTFDLAGYYKKRVIHAWRKLDVNCFYASAKLLFIYKNFMASGQLITPQKNYDDVGVFYRTPLIYNFNVGYNLNNWNFELGTRNPFSTFVKKREYISDIYSSYSRNYGPKINDHVFYVNVSYRFNWGKKHTFKQIEIEKTRNSAILKANE